MTEDQHHHSGFHGPKSWLLTALIGLVIGAIISFIAPAKLAPPHHAEDTHDQNSSVEIADGGAVQDGVIVPDAGEAHTDESHAEDAHHNDAPPLIPLWLVVPFAALLGSIAVMPFINEEFWHHHFPDFAFLLGGIVTAYYLLAFDIPYHGGTYGVHQMIHTGREYYAFIALIGGLFVASGGILIDVRGRGRPVVNTAMLAFGAVIANIVGTTGASVLLIRPFMRVNKGRLRPMHVVFFIFIIANCGGCLTPIGDPPLYLGFLKGVPFLWTLEHLWVEWAACVGLLLLVFLAYDSLIADRRAKLAALGETDTPPDDEPLSVHIRGVSGMIGLALIIAGVFIDPLLKKFTPAFEGVPIGPTFQVIVALATHHFAKPEYLEANEFTFFPVKEVGLLFIGIFATMTPALGYLAAHGHSIGLDTPTAFYFGTGSLSGVLDNAPTYLNFLQVAFGETPIIPENVHAFIATHEGLAMLRAISLGAVFFGAMTYIGNGPNFMVKAIAEAGGLRMPSFFGYLLRSILILLPTLVTVWAIFIHEW